MRDELEVAVEGIALRGRCGVSAEERAVGQTLVVDVRFTPRGTAALVSDELDDAVDYGHVVDLVREVVEGGEYRLLERLAGALVDGLWERLPLVALEVGVAKPAPPVAVPADVARVVVARRA